MFYLLIFVGISLGLYLASRIAIRRVTNSLEYQAEMARLSASYAAEETLIEAADWIGTTSLDEDIERELPKYLRREFGERLLDEGSLKARDLVYRGAYSEEDALVHYWSVPSSDGEPVYAYVENDSSGGSCTGWGNRKPPSGSTALRTEAEI